MSVFARLIKEARQADLGKPQNVYQEGRSVRFAKPLTEEQIRIELQKYAGDYEYKVYNDYLRFGKEKAADTAVSRQSFENEIPELKSIYKEFDNVVDERSKDKVGRFLNSFLDELNFSPVDNTRDKQQLADVYKEAVGGDESAIPMARMLEEKLWDKVDPSVPIDSLNSYPRLKEMGIVDIPESVRYSDLPVYREQVKDLIDNLDSYYPELQKRSVQRANLLNQVNEKIEPTVKKDILSIDKTLRQLPEEVSADLDGSRIQRGMHFSTEGDRQKFLDDVLFGGYTDENTSYWQDPAFHSVTTDPGRVDFFSKRNGEYPVVIDYDTSTRYPNTTFNDAESESIYPPDTWFEVLDTWREGDVERLKLQARYDDPRAARIHRSITPNSYDYRIQQKRQKERDKFNKRFGKKSLDELLAESDGNGVDFSRLKLDEQGSKELQELLGF
jgi:hypothetical protein